MNDLEIEKQIELLRTSNDLSILRRAIERLGQIGDSGKQVMIFAFFLLMKIGLYRVASLLLQDYQIGKGNSQAITELVKILSTSQNVSILWRAAESLEKIGAGNPQAIKALVKILSTSKDDLVLRQAAESLEQIGVSNPQAIKALVKILSTSKDDLVLRQAAESLGKIGAGNPQVIKALVKILSTSKDDLVLRQAAESLGKIGAGNPQVIKALVKILSTSKDDLVLRQAAESLGKIGAGNPQAIKALVKILSTSKDDSLLGQAAESLGKIDPGNPKASQVIQTLIETLCANKDTLLSKDIEIFEVIGAGNPKVIKALREIWHTTNSAYTRLLIQETLNIIDPSAHKKVPRVEEDLDLFLQVTRVKDTVDQYFAVNNHIKTKFCYHRIMASLERMQAGRDILTRRSLMKDYVEIHQRIVAYYLQKKEYSRAFFYIEVLRNRYLVERIDQQDNSLPETIATQLKESINQAQIEERRTLQEYTNGIASNLAEQQLEELGNRWDTAKAELEKLYTEVAKTEPEFIAKTKVNPIYFPEVRDSLSPDTAILEFFFTKRELVMMLILPGTEAPIVPESPTATIRLKALSQLAQDWNNDITEPKTTSKRETKKESKKNIEATITAIAEKIDLLSELLKSNKLLEYIPEQIKHLIIVPHQYLHLLPLHTLWLNETERLIDRFAVSYVPNLQVWQICQQRQREQNSLVCIENPSQDKKLLIVKAEVAALNQCQQFSQKQILTEGTSKTEIYQIAKNNHGFHFSGHAEYNLENPLKSYLMLSSENLTLKDIFSELQMPQTDLVTLSACDTAVVDAFQPTEEYLGLPTGFLLAGAKAVIGSLWKVNSISTAFLFDEFYRQLELTNNNKAIALQKAQNWLRNCSADELRTRSKSWYATYLEETDKLILEWTFDKLKGRPFQSPYYWAAFILTGG